MYAPILPFITEELYLNIYTKIEGIESIHISPWPKSINLKTNNDISDFDKAIEAIDEIRKYKSENNISLGKELEEFVLNTKVDLQKYGEFIKKAIRVNSLG